MTSPFSGTVSIFAMKDADSIATYFAGTTTGLQAAIDYLAGGKGKVWIGPGTLDITTVISVHSNCHIQGAGVDVTVIRRATGSMTTGDPTKSGCTFISTALGANGTYTATTGQVDSVTFSDLTLDGNQSNFGAVDPANMDHQGIEMKLVDGLRIENLRIHDFLQSGITVEECKNVFINNISLYKLGQYASASARNGISLINHGGTSAYSQSAVIQNCISDTITDAHFYLGNWSDVTYSNISMQGGGIFGFELETFSTSPSSVERVTVVNATADGLTQEFFRMSQNSGSNTTFKDILLRNCTCTFDASAHAASAVRPANGTSMIVSRFKMSGCTFLNCNSSNASARPFFYLDTTNTATPSTDITVEDCTFSSGYTASVLTDSAGVDMRGTFTNVVLQNVIIRDAPGKGIYIHPKYSGAVVQNVRVTNCSVYNSNDEGIAILNDVGTSTIKRIKIDGCYVEDSSEVVNNYGIRVGPTTASTTTQDVHIINNRVVLVASSGLSRGIRLEAGAGSTSDSYIIALNDFTGLSSGSNLEYQSVGTHTNVQFSDPVTRGADRGSSATLTLLLGTLFHITGTTSITTLNPCVTWERRPITFIFDSTAGFTDGNNLKLASTLVATADDTIVLQYDGSNWYELARSVN